ncbi:hypothetical protein B7486_60605, partial [cyanobacterium TDX16]
MGRRTISGFVAGTVVVAVLGLAAASPPAGAAAAGSSVCTAQVAPLGFDAGVVASSVLSLDGSTVLASADDEALRWSVDEGTATPIDPATFGLLDAAGDVSAFVSDEDLTGENPDHRNQVFVHDFDVDETTQVTDTGAGDPAPQELYDLTTDARYALVRVTTT